MPDFDFPPPSDDKAILEQGTVFSPRFDANGLITAVVVDSRDNAVLMLAYMNAEALALTLETGIGHFWSRSRKSLWKKGETSGNVLHVQKILADCDQDALVLSVTVAGDGVTCHTGVRSCFYRSIKSENGAVTLVPDIEIAD